MDDYYHDDTYRKHKRHHPIWTTFRIIITIVIVIVIVIILAIIGVAIWIAIAATQAVNNALKSIGEPCTTNSDCASGLVCSSGKCATH